mgnify:CR=1 FL=1
MDGVTQVNTIGTYWMSNQIKMREGCSKVRSVYVGLSGALWKVETVASRTKYIHCIVSRKVR